MRRRLCLLVVAATVVTGVSSLAWACVPVSWWVRAGTSSGVAGSTVPVTGDGFAADESVSIYWDSAATKLAEAAGPAFSLSVRIPTDAAPGLHRIQAVGSSGRAGATADFTVVANAPPARTGGNGVVGGEVPAPKVVPGDTSRSRDLVVTVPSDERSARGGRKTSGPPIVRDAAGVPIFAGVAPAQATFAGTPLAVGQPPVPSSGRSTGARSADKAEAVDPEPWSGFADESAQPLSPDAAEVPGSGTESGFGLGLGLLAAGLLALAVGLTAAEVIRRRRTG